MAKMLFDLQQGLVEIEGDEEFVERVYADIKDAVLGKLGTFSPSLSVPQSEEEGKGEGDGPSKKTRRKPRSAGPSCPSRIEALKADDFFRELRTSKDISDKLREKGTAYETKRIAAALHNLTAAGKLRRLQEGGVWKYQNP